MLDLLETQKQFLTPHIVRGGVAVDFTAGTGGDTLWMSQAVGPEGRVFAFDVQEAALIRTSERLAAAGAENCTLIHDSHERVADYVRAPFCIGMFNLGYLPGSDHSVTTMRTSTIAALTAAVELLAVDGAMTVAVYPGHEEGRLEGELVGDFLASLDKRRFLCAKFRIVNSHGSPYFFVVEKGSRWGKVR